MILAQTKQAEIEKFVEGMGFSLKLRAGVKASTQPAGAPAPPALGSGVRPAHQPRSGIRETTAPPVARKVEIKIVAAPEKKVNTINCCITGLSFLMMVLYFFAKIYGQVDPSSSEEVKKQIRNIKKKLTVIQELQDRQRTDKTFELSKEQKDKVQKRESLHQEMAHLEQLLVRCEVRERNSNSNNNNISSYSSASEEKKNKDESGDCFVLSSCTAAAAEVSICSAAQDALSPVEAKAVLSVPKKKKFSKGISLQEFNKVISSSGGGVPANLESWGKAVPSSKQSSPLVQRSAEQSASKPSPWKKISVATSRASATEHPSELNWESNGTALPQVAASSPSTTSTKAMLLTPNKNPPSASSAVTHQQSTASEILGGSPRKAFALADFLPGSGSGRKASSVIATTPQSAQSQSKACWGSPATIATTPSTRSLSQAAASRPSSAAAPAAALTPAPTLAPVNFSDIQRAEEAARQRSNIAALRGNNIPWYVERRPRAESLEHVIRQQALDKAVEEEHHRLKSMYFPPPEQSREKKATGRQEHRKKKPPDDKYKKSTANSKKSHKKSTV